MHRVAQLVGQGQHIAPLAHIVEEHVGVFVGGHRMRIGARRLAAAGPGVDPRILEKGARLVGEGGRQLLERVQHQGLGLLPRVAARLGLIEGGVAVPIVQLLAAERLGLQGVIAVRQARIVLHHRLFQGVDRLGVNLIGQVARGGRIGKTPPAVLDLFLKGDGVQAQGQVGRVLFQRLGQALRAGLALGRVRIGQSVQRLGQGQGLAPDLHLQAAERLIIQPRPVGHGGGAVDQQLFQVG